jgi:hypothetical protein
MPVFDRIRFKLTRARLAAIAVVALVLVAAGVALVPTLAQELNLVDDDDCLALADGLADVEDAEDAAEGPDVAITGDPLERASAAALAYLGEGRVTDTEIGDEEGYYEIEVSLPGGGQVDVHLDEDFNVLSTEADC